MQLRELDATFPIGRQLGAEASPAVLVNVFEVDPSEADALVRAWETDARWMKRQPGYISAQLHRPVGESRLYMNYAVWESVAHFRAAFTNPEFQAALAHYPQSTVAAPHLFQKVAVSGICTA